MNKNRKKIRFFLLGLFLFGGLFSYSFAQEAASSTQSASSRSERQCAHPPVCQMTPGTFNLYLEFQREMLSLMARNPFETETELISNPQGGLFTNKLLSLSALEKFDDGLLGRSLKITSEALSNIVSSTLTSVYLFQLSAISSMMDNSVGFLILSADRPLVRDWAKLLDVERSIIQTAYETGRAGDIAKTIKSSKLMNELIDSFEAKGLLNTGSQVPESISYMEVFAALYTLNAAQRMFLFAGDTSLLKQGLQEGNLQLTFNKEWIDQLKADYECVRWGFGYSCNRTWRSFKFNIQTLANGTAQSARNSKKMITDAIQRFRETVGQPLFPQLKKGPIASYLSEGEILLLRNVYGANTSNLYVGNSVPLLQLPQSAKHKWREMKTQIVNTSSDLWDGVKKVGNKIVNGAKNLINGEKQSSQEIAQAGKEAFDGVKRTLLKDKADVSLETFEGTAGLTIQQALVQNLSLLKEYEVQIRNNASANDSLLLSQQFGPLTYKVQLVIQEIGNKNEGLRKEINNLCNYQCRNSPEVICYSQ